MVTLRLHRVDCYQSSRILWGDIGNEQVEIEVIACGICHSDIAMLDNEWRRTVYPFVPGHEIVGKIVKMGPSVKNLTLGQIVGLGWFSQSCMHCLNCLEGYGNMCGRSEQTIVNRHGGFADRVRAHWLWVTPLPENMEVNSAGPLFCGGITVFYPLIQHKILPTSRVGVIGLGGLGHLAVQFLEAWGCEVTVFTTSASKAEEAKKFGAHNVVDTNDEAELKKIRKSLDLILCTVTADLNWDSYFQVLAPGGIFHIVGVPPSPIQVSAFQLIGSQRSISGSSLGSPAAVKRMLDFCVLHKIKAQVEYFKMSQVNEAIDHTRQGKARYRSVLVI